MPIAAPKPCRRTGCGKLVRDGTGFCQEHQADRKIGTFADPSRGTRQQRGYGAKWDKTRARILSRDNGLCQPCLKAGQVTTARQVDHVVPKAFGGSEDDTNLQAICKPCHQAKTAREATAARGGGGIKLSTSPA